MMHKMNDMEYCRDLVARDDPNRYFVSLFAPWACRADIWAVLAFNQEIAKIRETVQEPTLGLMRLQWWRDAIAALYADANIPGHPVCSALRQAIVTHSLPRSEFDTLIDARDVDVENQQPENNTGFESYADFTTTPLCMLITHICGHGQGIDRERVRYVAIAYALTGLLRAVPFHAQQGRCYLPHDMLTEQGITLSDIARGEKKMQEKLSLVVRDIEDQVQSHLDRAVDIGAVKPLLALRGLTALYLKQLKNADYNVYAPALTRAPAFKELRVFMHVMLSRAGQ